MKKICVAIVAFLIVIGTCSCSGQKNSAEWQEQYDLGVRYLSEGNYEEAIIAFTAAIEIDPKQPDTYIGLYEAYIGIGDYGTARSILEQGVEKTSDPSIEDMLSAFDYPNDWSSFLSDDLVSLSDFTIGGTPFYELSLDEAAVFLPIYDFSDKFENAEAQETTFSVILDSSEVISIRQYNHDNTLYFLSYGTGMLDHSPLIETEVRGISTGDSFADVLKKLGVSSAGAETIAASDSHVVMSVTSASPWIEPEYGDGISVDGIPTRYILLILDSAWCDFLFIDDTLIYMSVELRTGG